MKPDFSGEYALDRPASRLSVGAAAIDSALVRIEHVDPMFRYRGTFVAGGKELAYAFELFSDGREVAGEQNEVSSLRWEGDALVAMFSDSDIRMSWRYELQDAAGRLTAIEQLRGAGRDQDNVWVFKRV